MSLKPYFQRARSWETCDHLLGLSHRPKLKLPTPRWLGRGETSSCPGTRPIFRPVSIQAPRPRVSRNRRSPTGALGSSSCRASRAQLGAAPIGVNASLHDELPGFFHPTDCK